MGENWYVNHVYPTVGRRFLTGITSTIRTKSGYPKHGAIPFPTPVTCSTSEETTSESSFSGELTETCTSEPLQEHCDSDIDFDKEGDGGYSTLYCTQNTHSNQSTGQLVTDTRSNHAAAERTETRGTKKSLRSLFRTTNGGSRRGSAASAGDPTFQERVRRMLHVNHVRLFVSKSLCWRAISSWL